MMTQVLLSGGVLARSGRFYLLADHPEAAEEAEDGEALLCSGTLDGERIVLRELTGMVEIQKLIALDPPWTDKADAAVLTGDGAVYYLTPDSAQTEQIPGAGFGSETARGLGRMTGFRQIDDQLIAMGYRGQVYRRGMERGWEDISIPAPKVGEPAPAMSDVVQGPTDRSLIFVGSNIAVDEMTDAMDAANEAGDAELLAKLMLATIDDDDGKMSVRIYDGRWSEIDMEGEIGVIGVILRVGADYLLFTGDGLILSTTNFADFELVYRPETPTVADDVKLWKAEPLLLYRNQLVIFRSGAMIPFEPPLAPSKTRCLSVSPQGDSLAAIFEDHVQLLVGEAWVRLTPVMAA